MDPTQILAKLTTPEECEQFGINVAEKYPEISLQARRRVVELSAKLKGASSEVETESLRAIYAYEAALTKSRGKKTRASRTWRMVEQHGIIQAVERTVNRNDPAMGREILESVGMKDFSFEEVVLRYPDKFSADAVSRSKERLAASQ